MSGTSISLRSSSTDNKNESNRKKNKVSKMQLNREQILQLWYISVVGFPFKGLYVKFTLLDISKNALDTTSALMASNVKSFLLWPGQLRSWTCMRTSLPPFKTIKPLVPYPTSPTTPSDATTTQSDLVYSSFK